MKVAIISSGDPGNLKGIMNYVQEKCTLLNRQSNDKMQFDFYLIRLYNSFFLNLLLGHPSYNKVRKDKAVTIGTITYQCLWVKYTLWDNLFTTKIRHRSISSRYERKYGKKFKEYQVVSSHTILGHCMALYAKENYGIPYITTWHGSDVNIMPVQYPRFVPELKRLMDNASINLFISKALMKSSDRISTSCKKDVIYTGPSEIFRRFGDKEREVLRRKLGVSGKKVVMFAGNLVPIKNVLQLPLIFKAISDKYGPEKVEFWVVGNGPLESQLRAGLECTGVVYKMYGMLLPEQMPEVFNSADILLLISTNEGLGLVNMEAIQCGCNVLGSNVGGIPEVLGQKNVFDLGDTFVDNISDRAVQILENEETPAPLPACFSWDAAINKEVGLYNLACPSK